MKTLDRYKVTALVTALAAASFLPEIFQSLPTYLYLSFALIVAVLTGYVEYSRNRPLLKIQDKRTALLNYACETHMKNLRGHDSTARINIMEIDSYFIRRFGFFRIIYDLHVSTSDTDKGMRIWLKQGVCGDAANSGEMCFGDISDKQKGPVFGLNKTQQEKTKGIRLVISMPIRQAIVGGSGDLELTDKVIGVVNIDSKRRKAPEFYKTHQVDGKSLLNHQEKALTEISEFCSYILS